MKRIQIKDIASFIAFIDENIDSDRTYFRGQNADYPLIPKIGRLSCRESIAETEKKMIKEFIAKSIPYIDIKPDSYYEWLALAQHHGLPTRLLDWTLNPLAALWFAVMNPPLIDKTKKYVNGVVWFFEPDQIEEANLKIDPFLITKTATYTPKHLTRRIVAQSGCFTIHYLKNTSKFVPLERHIRFIDKLTKIEIEPSCFSDIRFQLDRLNINHASMFPDLDGLCRHIQWNETLFKDEN